MDLSAISPTLLVASLMVAATPILLAAIGELVVEKSGVLNLGVEGMMITGAISGFAAAVLTGSPMVGFLCAALGGAALVDYFRHSHAILPIQPGSYRLGANTVWPRAISHAGPKLRGD